MPTTPARPPLLLYSCIFVGVGSTLVLLELVDALSSWNSVAMQDVVRDALAEEPLAGTGITLTQAMGWLRVLAYVGVVVSTAAAVFAVFTARGDRTSRVMLTILCVLAALLFAAGGLVGIIPATVAMMSAGVLWSPDVRRWFDAVNGAPNAAAVSAATGASTAPGTDASTPSVPPAPGADPFASAPRPPRAESAPSSEPVPQAADPTPPSQAGPPPTRPGSVRLALVAGAVAHAMIVAAALVALATAATTGRDTYREALEQEGALGDLMRSSGYGPDFFVAALAIVAGACLVAGLVGIASIVFASRPRRHARLLVQLGLALALVAALLTLPFGLVSAVAAVVAYVQLAKPDTKRWYGA